MLSEARPETHHERILRSKDVDARTGISERQRTSLERQGAFPKRVTLGPRSHGYLDSEIREWIEKRRWFRDHPDPKVRAQDPVMLADTSR